MAVTSGFFNSRDGDRRYDARQVSELFDGVIGDGVFMHVGEGLQVFPTNSPNTVSVGTGRCWFDHVWVKNWPSRHLVSLPAPDEYYMRYDAIVVEIDHSTSGRYGYITWVKGTASSNPALPTLLNEGDHGRTQHPLAYVRRFANTTTINSSDINSRVGFSDCPWVVAPAGFVDLNKYWSNWEQQWSNWFTNAQNENETEFSEFLENKNTQYNEWQNEQGNDWATMKSELEAQTTQAVNASQDAIDGTLASQLQKQIDDLEFMNNMRPFPSMTMSEEEDIPETWYHIGSGYGAITYNPSVGGITFGVIENFVSPYEYTYNSEGDESPNDQNGYFISQIIKTTSPKALYVRTGYYRDPKYDDVTTVDLETGWDTGDNNANGWMRVASYNEVSNKVSKSGDTMTGPLDINLGLRTGWKPFIKGFTRLNEDDVYGFTLETEGDGSVALASYWSGATPNFIRLKSGSTQLKQPLEVSSGGTGSTNDADARNALSALGGKYANGYYGIQLPDGGDSNWIRVTQNGILPYQSGGNGNIGTTSWPFNNLYAKSIFPLGSTRVMNDYITAWGSAAISSTSWTKWIKLNSSLTIVSIYGHKAGAQTQTGIEIAYPFTIYDAFIGGIALSQPNNVGIYAGYSTRNNNTSTSVWALNSWSGSNITYSIIVFGRWF